MLNEMFKKENVLIPHKTVKKKNPKIRFKRTILRVA